MKVPTKSALNTVAMREIVTLGKEICLQTFFI